MDLVNDPTPSIPKKLIKGAPQTLPSLLANLDQETFAKFLFKLSKLAETKSSLKQRDLLSIFTSTKDPNYIALYNYLKTNEIEYLGGGNSINFKITPANPANQTTILKLEYRDDAPNNIKEQLTAGQFGGVVKSSLFERHGTWQPHPDEIPDLVQTRVLAITCIFRRILITNSERC